MEYYSQFGQDKYLDMKIFKEKQNGFFLDIGAYDGVLFSNTCFFEKNRGWSGICVEPDPETFEKLKSSRRCDLENIAISSKTGELEFIKAKGNEVLSVLSEYCSEEHINRIRNESGSDDEIKKIVVRSLNINEFLEARNIEKIDYLSIDVEGGEYDILKEIDFKKVEIQIISTELNTSILRMIFLMSKRGFVFDRYVGADVIFVKKKGFFFSRFLVSLIRRLAIKLFGIPEVLI